LELGIAFAVLPWLFTLSFVAVSSVRTILSSGVKENSTDPHFKSPEGQISSRVSSKFVPDDAVQELFRIHKKIKRSRILSRETEDM
jgi:hypothetical protein